MITDVEGIRVGHWTHAEARTGCTVVLLPEGTVGSGEVRGGAPATREFELLRPDRLVRHIDAIVLTGGSAFGLAACDGVARWCEEHGRGFPTPAAAVPIVVGAAVFDLAVGDGRVRPGADEGYEACLAATTGSALEWGAVGAGAGATVDNWLGAGAARPGGVGTASVTHAGVVVAALVVVNAYGSVLEPGARAALPPAAASTVGASGASAGADNGAFANTTIGVVATDAPLDKSECHLVAQSAHDGLARALEPAHTRFDGDAFVAVATGTAGAMATGTAGAETGRAAGPGVDVLRVLAARVVEDAIRRAATPLPPH